MEAKQSFDIEAVKREFYFALLRWSYRSNATHSTELQTKANAYLQAEILELKEQATFFAKDGFYNNFTQAVKHTEAVKKQIDKDNGWLNEVDRSKDTYELYEENGKKRKKQCASDIG